LSASDTGAFTRYDRAIEPRISADEADSRFAAWRSQVHA